MGQSVSIDIGSGFTQYTKGTNDEGYFPSIVCPVPEIMGFGTDDAEVIKFNDTETFLIGEDAKAFGSPDTRFGSLHDEWAGSAAWKALFYGALARLNVSGDIRLVTGLPQSLYSSKNQILRELLDGEHTFQYKEREYHVNIKPWIVPQAAGALFYQASKDDTILSDAVGVIDVGTYTTGYSVIEQTRFVAHRSNGCSTGVAQLAEALKNHLRRDYGYSADDAKLPKILIDRSVRLRGNMIDLTKDIDTLALTVARPMLEKIECLWQSADDLLVFVAGGGAPYYFEAIKTIIPHAELMDEYFNAVVRGMYNYLTVQD